MVLIVSSNSTATPAEQRGLIRRSTDAEDFADPSSKRHPAEL